MSTDDFEKEIAKIFGNDEFKIEMASTIMDLVFKAVLNNTIPHADNDFMLSREQAASILAKIVEQYPGYYEHWTVDDMMEVSKSFADFVNVTHKAFIRSLQSRNDYNPKGS